MRQRARTSKPSRKTPAGRLSLPARRAGVGISFLFIARPERGHYVRDHAHETLELVYYTEGTGATTVDGTRHRIVRNTFAIMPAGCTHDQTSTTDLLAVCIGLTGSGLEDLAGVHRDVDGLLRRPLEHLLAELQAEEPGFDAVARGLALQITGLARRAASKEHAPSRKVVVDRALAMIRDRDGDLSVGELSERLYVSKDYLRHLFKEYTRASPLRHIINRRIEKAKTLLGRDDLGIAEVAARCGIDNPYYFSRLFKQVTGQTPSGYRRSVGD